MPKTVEELKGVAKEMRAVIKRMGDSVQEFKGLIKETADQGSIPAGEKPIDFGEVIANAVLAYRHLEDARMRLGKSIQHLDGGVSKYDRPSSPPRQQQQ
jgi:hypothetical protein